MKYSSKYIEQLLLLLLLLLSTCNSDNIFSDKYYREYMSHFSDINGKVIIFPNQLKNYNDYKNYKNIKNQKVIICIGYMNCSPCIIRLKEVEKFHNNFPDIPILYIVLGEENDYFKNQVRKNNFTFTILHDRFSDFIKLNGLENYTKSVFLINEKSEIILVGEPFHNKIIQNFYTRFFYE